MMKICYRTVLLHFFRKGKMLHWNYFSIRVRFSRFVPILNWVIVNTRTCRQTSETCATVFVNTIQMFFSFLPFWDLYSHHYHQPSSFHMTVCSFCRCLSLPATKNINYFRIHLHLIKKCVKIVKFKRN